MQKKEGNGKHPVLHTPLTFGQRAADQVAGFAGSWFFILLLFCIVAFWITLNAFWLAHQAYDPFPFILLNLALSTLAAIQAPIILMAQNRQAERDRINASYDYQVNRKAEREIQNVQQELRRITAILGKRL